MHGIEKEKLSEIANELSELHSITTQISEAGDNYNRFTLRGFDDHLINLHQISLDIKHRGLQVVCARMRENIHHHILAGSFLSKQEIVLVNEWKTLVKAYVNDSSNEKVVEALLNNLAKEIWPKPVIIAFQEELRDKLYNPFDENQKHLSESDNSSNPDFENSNSNSKTVEDIDEFDTGLDSVFTVNEEEGGEVGVDLSVTIETSYKDVSSLVSDDALIDELYDDSEDIEEHSLGSYFEDEDSSGSQPAEDVTPFSDSPEVVMSELFTPDDKSQESLQDEDSAQIIPDEESLESQFESKDSDNDDVTISVANDADTPDEKMRKLYSSKTVSADNELADEIEQDDGEIDNGLSIDPISSFFEEGQEEAKSDDSESPAPALSKNEKFRQLFVSKEDSVDETESDPFASSDDGLDDEDDNLTSITDELFSSSGLESEENDAEKNEQAFDDDLQHAAESEDQNEDSIKLIGLNKDTADEKEEADDFEQPVSTIIENELFSPVEEAETEIQTAEDYEKLFEQDLADAAASDEQEQLDSTTDDEQDPTEPVEHVSADDQDESADSEQPGNDKQEDSTISEEPAVPAEEIKKLEEELIEDDTKNEISSEPVVEKAPVSMVNVTWSDEQKELLSIIVAEVQDTIAQQHEALQVFDAQPVNEEDVRDVLMLYAEQLERMASAADMVGLIALQKIAKVLQSHFIELNSVGIDQIVISKERIKKWPHIILRYLSDIYSPSVQQIVLDYIFDQNWPISIDIREEDDLSEAFSYSTIRVEKSSEDQRLKVASDSDINISISDDVQPDLLDGMLQELPHQTEDFAKAIQNLVADDYLQQLEVAQRIAHTIKGAANTVGVAGVATLTHNLEDILQALLKAQAKPSEKLHESLVDASDTLEQMSEFLMGSGTPPDDALSVLQTVLDWANYIDEFGPPEPEQDTGKESAEEEPISESNTPVAPAQPDSKARSNSAKREKSKAAADSSLRVPTNVIDELLKQSGESIITASQMAEQVDHVLAQLRDMKINKDSVHSLSQQLEHLIDIQGVGGKYLGDELDDKFDPLEMDQYNELHTYSRRLIEATADSVELVKQLETRILQLEASVASQLRAQKEYQHAVLTTRMVPAETIVQRLKRGVRQSAKISDKSVELTVSGGDTLVDSKILTNLIDPLMHLLRNAVDHGIEHEERRQASGKELTGRIELSFAREGDRIVVSCLDDGKGLDVNKIKEKAIDKKLVDVDQELSDDEIHQLIMRHGFSTRSEVTQLSGRGVGLDVVYSSIKELNGSINVNSQPGMGMTVELSFPVSLLSMHALLVKVTSRTIALSTNGIEEIVQAKAENFYEEDGNWYLKHEEESLLAVPIEELLGIAGKPERKKKNYTALLVNEIGDQKKVVLVDRVLSTNDIVIKPFSRFLPKVLGIIGATVLGGGEVATVVDLIDLLSQESDKDRSFSPQNSDEEVPVLKVTALIVEDSISTRKSLAEFMQDLNYEVYTAKDGVEAIEQIRKHRPNILLTDLEMPRMNGLELTSHLRSNEETKDLPVIMITSRTTEKHRQEAIAIGVNEYLSKPYQEDLLLEMVQQLAPIK